MLSPTVRYFRSMTELRQWFTHESSSTKEVWIGFYKKNSGLEGVTYREALDEALCFGWIDGIRKKVDEVSYCNRFTPRKNKSSWSSINVARYRELLLENRVHEYGQNAFRNYEKHKEMMDSKIDTLTSRKRPAPDSELRKSKKS